MKDYKLYIPRTDEYQSKKLKKLEYYEKNFLKKFTK